MIITSDVHSRKSIGSISLVYLFTVNNAHLIENIELIEIIRKNAHTYINKFILYLICL